MKIRRIKQPEVFVDCDRCGITPAMLIVDGRNTRGWYDTEYGKFYIPSEWEEVPPEPAWVEVDLTKTNPIEDMWFTTPDNVCLRLTDGYVKVSELEKWPLTSALAAWCARHQHPVLTVWEKKP